jgi:hypothetical protein
MAGYDKGNPGHPDHVDIERAWHTAKTRNKRWNGLDADAAAKRESTPIAKARAIAEAFAPADMRLSVALGHGLTPAELEADKVGTRLMADLAHKRLGIVGLRAGDSIEEGMSDRMSRFLDVFFERPSSTPAAVETTNGDTPRRRRRAP